MTEKRRYRTGKGRQSEEPQEILVPGDVDRMSILARNWGLPKCGTCTRVSGHDEKSENTRHRGNDPRHPSRQHVEAPDGIVLSSWWSDDEQRQETAG